MPTPPHQVRPLPRTGDAFLDARGDGRALRVSWHAEADVVVLSLWRDRVCTGTVQLDVTDVPALLEVLTGGRAANSVAV